MTTISRKILVVEDDIEFCDNLTDILELENYEVTVVHNADDAIREVKEGNYPVVIQDLRLPGEGGTSILKRIKEILPQTQVIIMTAFASIETAIDALERDAYAYLVKPMNMKELIITIDRAFQDVTIKIEKDNLLKELTRASIKMVEQNLEIMKKNRELEIRNDELASLIYAISHDLKSSLVTFHGYLDFLNESDLDAGSKKFVDRLLYTANKMSGQIKDLLQVATDGNISDSGTVINICELVREIVEEISPGIRKKDAKITISEDMPEVFYSRKRLKRVFENLMTNAFKFSYGNENQEVEIGWKSDEKSDKYIFYVRDNGIGIEQAYHEKIFGIFEKLEEIPGIEGSGIGLSVVRRIIQNQNGKIWLESEKGQGSTFYFTVDRNIPLIKEDER
ncbi:MAG: response regulator [Firmicutes bacterium]|nr:response regulator [Bacillota bacterium]